MSTACQHDLQNSKSDRHRPRINEPHLRIESWDFVLLNGEMETSICTLDKYGKTGKKLGFSKNPIFSQNTVKSLCETIAHILQFVADVMILNIAVLVACGRRNAVSKLVTHSGSVGQNGTRGMATPKIVCILRARILSVCNTQEQTWTRF